MRGLLRQPSAVVARVVPTAALLLGLFLQLALPGIHGAAIGAVSRLDALLAHASACSSATTEAEIHDVAPQAGHDAESCPQCQSFSHARAAGRSAPPVLLVLAGDVPVRVHTPAPRIARAYPPAAPRAPPATLLASA